MKVGSSLRDAKNNAKIPAAESRRVRASCQGVHGRRQGDTDGRRYSGDPGAAAKGRPPAQVLDSFRDVQAARSDAERAQNEAQTYANRVVPEGRGRAAQITQAANAYREQTVAEATGQAARFLKIYEEYKKAPEVTRQRMYLETMERLFGGTDKIILDSGAGNGVVPYLPLTELTRPQNPRPAAPPNPAQTPQTGGSR